MIISKTDLLEVKKDYLDKVMIRDGSEESKKAEQILNETCEAFINDINENFGNRITVEKLIMLTLLTVEEIEELENEWLKKILKEAVMGFSSEIFVTFFSEKDGTC
mgnify:FL=1